MIVTINKKVTCCADCPHFDSGPYEMACQLYEKAHGAYSSLKFLYRRHNPNNGKHIKNHIPTECPIK